MKAYSVNDRNGWVPYSVVVFAESRGKAVSYALYTDEFTHWEFDFTGLRAVRAKWADKCYRGNKMMDWDNDKDRIAMVKDGGFVCDDDCFDYDDCKICCAKEFCGKYEEYKDEDEEYE